MLRSLLARLGLYLVTRFHIYKGPTYSVRLGRTKLAIHPSNKSLRGRAIAAWENNQSIFESDLDLKYLQQGLISPYKQGHN